MLKATVLPLVVLVLLAPTLAGCLGDEPTAASGDPTAHLGDDPSAPYDPTAPTATVRLLALSPDLDRIAGALVEIGNRTNTTDDQGLATLTVAPGNHSAVVSKDGWRSARLKFTATAGEKVDLEAKLFPGDQVDDQEPDNEPYQREFDYTGVFECFLVVVIVPGDCMALADFAVDAVNQAANDTTGQQDVIPITPGDATEDQNVFEFPVDAGWESIVVEMAWEAPLAPIAEKMQVALEPSEAPADGHAAKYARVHGVSPQNLTVHKGVPHATASTSADGDEPDMPNPAGGEVVMVRAYIIGEGHNPAGTDFLGVGAAYSHKFDIFVTVFYNEPAPDGFSRLP